VIFIPSLPLSNLFLKVQAEIWNEILSDGVPPSVADRKINCFVANWEGNLIASCILAIVPMDLTVIAAKSAIAA
jgi:hypothetical protein